MADDIRQEFILDAADALRDLETLMKRYKSLNITLNKFGGTVSRYNANATKLTANLNKIKEAAKGAADQLARVSRFRGGAAPKAPTPAAAAAGPAQAAGGVDPNKTKQAAASLEELKAAAAGVFSGAPIKNQKLFNAGLNELVAGFHRTGGSVEDFKQKVRDLDSRINGSKARMTAAMRAIGKSTKQNLNTTPIRNFVVSWKTMMRVVTTQLIVRGLNVLRQSLKEAVLESIEFQKAVAEIATIANGAYGSLGDIAKIVRETSDEFGKGRLDVAEGLYQTLSNQVGDAAESLHVFRTANKLSIAAVSSTEDAVNLLTAALNSFDIDASRAESVAAKLFRTVELGRTRVSELADTFGRIGPLAKSLGISLEETLAAIATITIQGTRTAESMTQVRGVMQGLLKPSDNLKKAFKELGVENAETLIATYGFQGALLELTKTSGTSSSEMGKLIRRVRGLLGAITLASQDAETFVKNLEQIEEASADLLQRKFELVFETPGAELEREFNKLKNVLVEDIGRSLVKASLAVIDFTKKLGGLLAATTQYATAVGVLLIPLFAKKIAYIYAEMAAWIALRKEIIVTKFATVGAAKASVIAAAKAAAAWIAAAGPFIAVAAAIGVVVYALRGLENTIATAYEATKKLIKSHIELQKAVDTKVLQKHYEIQKKINDLNTSDTLKVLAAVQRAYKERAEVVNELNDREIEAHKQKFQKILDALEEYQSRYEDIAEDANDQILDSQERVYDIQRKGDTERFNRSLRWLDNQDQVYAKQKRILELNKRAQGLLVTGDPKKIQQALQLYGEAEGIYGNLRDLAWEQLEPLERAFKAGELSADRYADLYKARIADNRALAMGNNLTQARLQAEAKLQQIEAERARIAEQRAQQLEALNAKFSEQFDIIFANMKQFDDDNKRLSAEELQEQAKARARAFNEIRQLANTLPGTFDYNDFFGLAQLSASLDDMLSERKLTIAEDSINQIGKTIGDAFDNYLSKSMEIRLRELSRILGVEFDPSRGFEDLSNAVVESKKRVEQLQKEEEKLIGLEKEVARHRKEAELTVATGAGLSVPLGGAAEYQAAFQALNKMAAGVQLTTQESIRLQENMNAVRAAWDGIGNRSERVYEQLRDTHQALAQMQIAQEQLANQQQLYNQLSEENELFRREQAISAAASGRVDVLRQTHSVRGEEAAAAGNTLTIDQQLANIARQRADSEKAILTYKQAQSNLEQTIRPQEELRLRREAFERDYRERQLGGLIRGYAKGGLVKKLSYLARGSYARGTDTIPAMLSPGEFVMNAKSTRRFFSHLVAMNSGRAPIFRQEGGPVTNVTVGDVNVHAGEGKTSPHQLGRHVVAAIKREVRRGTSSF